MDTIQIVKFDSVQEDNLPDEDAGMGFLKRIIYPHSTPANGFAFGYGEVPPGKSLHRWHNHSGDTAKGLRVIYAEGFEELYFILKGTGVVQWKDDDGQIKETEVQPKDTILFKPGVPDHQVLNNGDEDMLIAYVACPPITIIKDDNL